MAAPQRQRVLALDGIRGAAVLVVVLLHSGVISWGWMGVDVFFVLSGYLITTILLDARAPATFYGRRALRILPLAFVVMAVAFFVLPVLGRVDWTPKRELAFYVAFVSNWWLGPRSDGAWMLSHLWSLGVEEQFYLLWPWAVWSLSRRRLAVVAALLVVSGPLIRIALTLAHLPPQIGHTYESLTVTRWDGLGAGALLAVVADAGWLTRARPWLMTTLVAGLALFVALPTSYVWNVTGATLLAAGLIGGALVMPSLGRPFLPLRWLGTVSYGLYLIHPFVVRVWRGHGVAMGWPLFWRTFAVSSVLAAVSWRCFEAPILSLKRLFPLAAASERATTDVSLNEEVPAA